MGLFTKIFGGSREKSESGNLAYNTLNSAFSPMLSGAGQGASAISALLGIGGNTAAQSAAFDNYKDSTGYNFMMDSGRDAVLGNQAAKGLFRSGSTGKALTQFGQQLGDTYFNNYMDRLLGYSELGLKAGGVLSSAGQYSKGKGSKDTGAFGQFLGGLFSSDPRLKQNVVKLYELEDGLGVYSYEYIDDPDKFRNIGVMADEVAEKRPWALGPEIDGYMTVDYDRLMEERDND